MPNLEADFVPYYLLTRNYFEKGDEVGNVIYSNDHDLWQCLDDHVFIFSKIGKRKKILKSGNVMESYLKKKNDIPDSYLPFAMSVIGDSGDDVTGVEQVGPATFLKVFDQLVAMTGSLEQIYDKVESNQDLFNFIPPSISNKKLDSIVQAELAKKTISNNLKLVSFELISRAIENPSSTEMRDKRKVIENHFKGERQVASLDAMKSALKRNGVFLEESSIDFLYI